jgi:pilus assembly protein CpaB
MSMRLIFAMLLMTAAVILGFTVYQMSTVAPPAVPTPTAAAPPPLQVTYLVTAHALPAGTLLRDTDFASKSSLPDQVPAGAQPDTADMRASLRGALVPRYLDGGVAVRAQDVLRPRDRGFLAAVLSPGARAVSVGVDAISGVSGLIWPGDRVDVILTREVDPSVATTADKITSEILLTGVRIIAVDQSFVQGAAADGQQAPRVARTVTLEVSPEQAGVLAVAQRQGSLSLAIRPMQGDEADGTTGAPEPGHEASTESPPGPNNSSSATNNGSVQVIEGDQRSEVKFR